MVCVCVSLNGSVLFVPCINWFEKKDDACNSRSRRSCVCVCSDLEFDKVKGTGQKWTCQHVSVDDDDDEEEDAP